MTTNTPALLRSWVPAMLVLIALAVSPLVSVAAAQDADAKVLRVAQPVFPPVLDPQLAASYEIETVTLNYEGPTRIDAEGNTVPGAAETWEFTENGSVLTFHLRDDLVYSDGSPLTAERFRYAVERTCDPLTGAPYQAILFDVVGCEAFAATDPTDTAAYEAARSGLGAAAPDDRTLVLRFTKPAPYFPAVASTWVLFPAKQELIEQGGEGWWLDPALQVGNGPFQIDRIDPDQLISFAANERYWAGRPKLDRIDYVVVADPEMARGAYEAGDVDIIHIGDRGLPPDAREVAYPVPATMSLGFNLALEPFSDKQVREAFAYAFDRETLCATLWNGGCQPALSWIPPGSPGHIETDAYAFDPEKARQALAASSYGGPEGLPEITFAYYASSQTDAEWIAGQYRDLLGVTLRLEPLDDLTMESLQADPATFPQATFLWWGQDYPDPQNWLSFYWACPSFFAKNVGYCNPAFDALIAQADAELDPAARLALYEEAGRLLVADAPVAFLINPWNRFAVRPGVTADAMVGLWPGHASLLSLDIAH